MKDTFNIDYYFAAATIIPVLFLAFALQTPFLERLRSSVETAFKTDSGRRQRNLMMALQFVGFIVLFTTLFGEIMALLSLMYRFDLNPAFILWSMFILLVAVMAIPASIIFRPMILMYREQFKEIRGAYSDLKTELRERKAKKALNEPRAPDDQA